MSAFLRLGAFHPCTEAMGPGKRACIWVRGCPFRCTGCITEEFQTHASISDSSAMPSTDEIDEALRDRCAIEWPGSLPVDAPVILDWIARAKELHNIEGVSFSGGEPFVQAEALATIARACHNMGLSTLSWSGYTLGRLKSKQCPLGAREFLKELDVLIDGPFVQALACNDPLRGSSNQEIHFLTDRYARTDLSCSAFEITLDPASNRFIITGVAPYASIQTVMNLLSLP